MNYLSVCSGIEAASVAWEPLGFKPVGFSEIEKFPSQVLAHRFPTVRNYGDMTKYKEWELDEPVDILVGGTPCQSFSVAGLRKGLEDPRGNLMLTYLAIADRLRPRWLVWENVPGVLSSNGGRDFGTFLGALVELGYGFAYRVLDAQWFGVAQRRRRVFVVGCLGGWQSAAAVLFERESVCRHPAPSREKREGIATNVDPSLTASNNPSRSPQSSEVTQQVNAILEAQVVGSLDTECGGGKLTHQSIANGHILVDNPKVKWQSPNGKDIVGTMRARDYKRIGNDDLTEGRGLSIAYAFEPGIAAREGSPSRFSTLAPTLRSNAGDNQPAVAFARTTSHWEGGSIHPTLNQAHNIGSPGYSNQELFSQKGAGLVSTAVAFAQNTRDEVRLVGGDGQIVGALAAQPGMKQTSYIAFSGQMSNPLTATDIVLPLMAKNPMALTFTAAEARRTGTIHGAETVPTLTSQAKGGDTEPCVSYGSQVRRLTPMECERLQGFPDNWTNIRINDKPTPDGPRYKAIGNSMAVPVMRWIGERIHAREAALGAM